MMNQIKQFQSQLLHWYDKHGRKDLPWQVDDSYLVWISEIMLQQTQVVKVIDYFNAFTAKFPSMTVLAEADVNEVLAKWSGLGYYNRARNIHRTAQICVQQYSATLPLDLKQLMALPGIGQTTAGAILSLASDLAYPILDGNVKRVMSRVHKVGDVKLSQYTNKLWQIVDDFLSKKRPRNYNQALMDLGSMVCVRSKPRCHLCPLAAMCQAYLTNETELYPPKKSKTKQKAVTMHTLLLINKGKVLLCKRQESGIWAGLWFLPEIITNDGLMQRIKQQHKSFAVQHILSHRILTIEVFKTNDKAFLYEDGQWVAFNNLSNFAHPSALVKILQVNSGSNGDKKLMHIKNTKSKLKRF